MAMAPWLSVFDELVAIRLILIPVHVYGYVAKPHSHICGAVLTESLWGWGTMVNSVLWTGSNMADSCPCIFGYMAMWLFIRNLCVVIVWLQGEGS